MAGLVRNQLRFIAFTKLNYTFKMPSLSVFYRHSLSQWVCLLCLLWSAFSSSQEDSDRKIYVVRGDDDYSPYEMVRNNQLIGFHVELTQIVAKQLNIELVFESLPWKRALAMVEKGLADAITYVGKNPRRERYIIFTPGNELSWAIFGLVVLDDRKNDIHFLNNSFTSLQGYKIGQLLGYSYGNDFDRSLLNRSFYNKNDQLIGMLRTKRIDIAILNKEEYENKNYNEEGIQPRLAVLDNLIGTGNYIGFSKKLKLESLSNEFSQALILFKKTQAFKNLQKKYGAKYK